MELGLGRSWSCGPKVEKLMLSATLHGWGENRHANDLSQIPKADLQAQVLPTLQHNSLEVALLPMPGSGQHPCFLCQRDRGACQPPSLKRITKAIVSDTWHSLGNSPAVWQEQL